MIIDVGSNVLQLPHHLADPLVDLLANIGNLLLRHDLNDEHRLSLPYWHHQLVLSWYHHQPGSHQADVISKVSKRSVSGLERPVPIDRSPGTPGSGKNYISRINSFIIERFGTK